MNDREIVITEESVRRFLRFDDEAHDRVEFGYTLLQGCFGRMGYRGNLNMEPFNKKNRLPIWRFLVHVLIVCFSARKGGFDSANQAVQSAIVALVLNKRYNFTRFIFNSMKSNITEGIHRFIMFPRYIQLFLEDQVPNLPQEGRISQPRPMLKRVFADCRNYRPNPVIEAFPLFGHILNVNYVMPPQDNWKNPEDQGQVQQPVQQPVPAPQPPVQPATPPVPPV